MASLQWRASVPQSYQGPCIALIHGLAAGKHMERHLLHFLRHAGYADTTLYSNFYDPVLIALDLREAASSGRPIALIGFSQGGFQVLKVARLLKEYHVPCDLVVSIAAGGLGRLVPPQWGFNVRYVPANITRYLNYFAANDRLGTDQPMEDNLAHTDTSTTFVENIAYPPIAGLDHLALTRCYPSERVFPEVRHLFLDRLLAELERLG